MLLLLANFEGLNPCQSFGISAKLSEGTREQGTGNRGNKVKENREQEGTESEQKGTERTRL